MAFCDCASLRLLQQIILKMFEHSEKILRRRNSALEIRKLRHTQHREGQRRCDEHSHDERQE
jgi:hypothetical protein